VEIWAVSTAQNRPYATPSGPEIRYGATKCSTRRNRPSSCRCTRVAAAASSDSANVRPAATAGGVRCGISTASAEAGFTASTAVISASAANSS
jgi:hypothetical protein